MFSEVSSDLVVPHLFDISQDSEGPEALPLLDSMNSDDEDFVVPEADGVNSTSSVRRRVLGKIRIFKAAVTVCDPSKYQAEVARV